MMPKTAQTAMQLQQFISSKTVQDVNLHLGMSKIGGHWIWDDGSPVFVRCKKSSLNFIFGMAAITLSFFLP